MFVETLHRSSRGPRLRRTKPRTIESPWREHGAAPGDRRRHSHERGARYTFAHSRNDSLWIIHVSAPPPCRSDTCTVCIHAPCRAPVCRCAVPRSPVLPPPRPPAARRITSTLSSACERVYLCASRCTCVRARRRNGISDGTRHLFEASRAHGLLLRSRRSRESSNEWRDSLLHE